MKDVKTNLGLILKSMKHMILMDKDHAYRISDDGNFLKFESKVI